MGPRMSHNVGLEVPALRHMRPKYQLLLYAEVFGETTHIHDKGRLVKRLAWRLRALAEGGLSDRARRRAGQRRRPPHEPAGGQGPRRPGPAGADEDPRGDVPGGRPPAPARRRHHPPVQGRDPAGPGPPFGGFEYEGQVFPSLSPVAKHVTGIHCNGYLFFRLGRKGDDR
jgi:hypothetical protein